MTYSSLEQGLSKTELDDVKSAGCVIVRGAVPEEEALSWDRIGREYIVANEDKVRGKHRTHALPSLHSKLNCYMLQAHLQTKLSSSNCIRHQLISGRDRIPQLSTHIGLC